MALSLELSIVVWSRYIALKLFYEFGKIMSKRGPYFTTSTKYFTKTLKL